MDTRIARRNAIRLSFRAMPLLFGTMVLLLVDGCGFVSLDPDGTNGSGAGGADRIRVRSVDRAGYDEVLAQLRGSVVLVDFWATWCQPCVMTFPHTVRMSRQYDGPNFKVVSVSLDDPDDLDDAVEFLRSQGATFENLMSSYGGLPESIEKFEIEPPGIPHYKLYDMAGQLRYTFAGYSDEIELRSRELLAEQG